MSKYAFFHRFCMPDIYYYSRFLDTKLWAFKIIVYDNLTQPITFTNENISPILSGETKASARDFINNEN